MQGDGIGPEVIAQAVKVLGAVGDNFNHEFSMCYAPIGGEAIRLTGNPLPEDTLNSCLKSDGILLGSIGNTEYNDEDENAVRPEAGLLSLRKSLQLYANIRPVKTFPAFTHLSPLKASKIEIVDFVIFRELISVIYFCEKGRDDSAQTAYDVCWYSKSEIEQVARFAFKEAERRRKKVTLVDKANVLETSRLWRRVVKEIAKEFPAVTYEKMYVDHAAMEIILRPAQFDVILTSNMFGDILSDEACAILGSMGFLPSASIGKHTSVFGPVHGSNLQLAGKDVANPTAAILSVAMMLDTFGLNKEARAVRFAIHHLLEKGISTAELDQQIIQSCSQFGDLAASMLETKNSMNIDESKFNQQISTII